MLHITTGGFEGQYSLDNIEDSGRPGLHWDWKAPGRNAGWEEEKTGFLRGEEYCIFVGTVCTNTCDCMVKL